ncbi:MIP family channel protein [Streptomyces sp. NPDC051776]|uniref:MIP family channel protein n=1 Tax=Streptomyces sp. NPDC051776 TaxID=3155414 RepID=UPI003414E373
MGTTTRTVGLPGGIDARTVVSEFLGTLLLVFFGVGSAVLGAEYIGTVGIALAFGFALLALAYALGPISGCHLNPAVTLGMLMAKRLSVRKAVEYWIAQLLGAIVGAALLLLVAKQVPGLEVSGAFGTNGYGYRSALGINIFGAFVAEILMTFLLVYVYLAVTRDLVLIGFAALPVGLVLALVQLIGVPLTGASVNPVRSLGPAIFAGSAPMSQVWLFLIAPLVGGVIAALVHAVTHGGETFGLTRPAEGAPSGEAAAAEPPAKDASEEPGAGGTAPGTSKPTA